MTELLEPEFVAKIVTTLINHGMDIVKATECTEQLGEIFEKRLLEETAFLDSDDAMEVMGWPNFKCGPYAHLFREKGHRTIKKHAEEEQAFVIHWLLGLIAEHPNDWRKRANEIVDDLINSPIPQANTNDPS